MWFTYTMEYYSTPKKKKMMNFAGKWMEPENIILSEVTQTQKDMHDMHSLISRYQPKSTEGFGYNLQNGIIVTQKCPNEEVSAQLRKWKDIIAAG